MQNAVLQQPSAKLSVQGLTKTYRGKTAVHAASFDCAGGTITGFVGPNGSGKSTTLRMILGHTRADAGQAYFDGVPYVDLHNPGRTVGVLLDASAHHDGRTVRETLRLAALTIGVTKARTRACQTAVGLESVGNKRVGSLSLGMRQRLGIAVATLGAPRFLILDEPANGLDPEGIRWLRQLLKSFAATGGTALVSSHQLAELEMVADKLIVIDRGRAREQEPRAFRPAYESVVSTENDVLFRERLTSRGINAHANSDHTALLVEAAPDIVGRIARDSTIAIDSLTSAPLQTLEDFFLETTSGEHAAGDDSALFDLLGRPKQ
ncbi:MULTISPECIES: ATP-binding cassette domain-containing protein [unclassified Frondihabitans]|uniref:ATP-binding cassette domain-containing protein n=1 Tax=unclassified Frondihabitans TaxID=2626248 RepID=UPI000F4FEEC9|nr:MULTISPECIES: ATP-binding cassette domain-containing protein [unclassified Frondihabitans]RPE77969.1 ABC-2 type transport system ATP-binding protein [Frondihabitans sp. PhB153]RPF08249.1 ABC-2 type transport system ATP-binding protein [Frondihabitans sp. PhB161]